MTDISVPETHASAILTIDLAAIVENYRTLQKQTQGVECAAVVKANGYGLGAEQVGGALLGAGCRKFFVAHLDEGIDLRAVVGDAEIHILGGLVPGVEDVYRQHKLVPVLGSLGEIAAWKAYADGSPLPCDIHVDTGMLRLGLPPAELRQIADHPQLMSGLEIRNVISHLAAADTIHSPQSGAQLRAFKEARRILPQGQACFANSSGIFWGSPYHFDLVRPGVALYGVNPTPDSANPMRPTVELQARIVQLRDARAGDTVGYGATYKVKESAKIATLAVGYADGYLRALSGKAFAYLGGHRIPLVGRVSMDLITFDVSQVPHPLCHVGAWVELIGANHKVDDLAREADTIGYEVLTSLGSRYHRVYKT
ncbi:MAG: alanine racemase [Rhodospirillales bacterium]|nr:alanine racemase [Rhodospirillales bacterium]